MIEITSDELLSTAAGTCPALLPSIRASFHEPEPSPALIDPSLYTMEHLLGALLWAQLQASGWFNHPSLTVSDLRGAMHLPASYQHWLDATLTLLNQRGFLTYDAASGTMTDPQPVEPETLWQEWEQRKQEWLTRTDLRAQILLVDKTIHALPQILQGRIAATDVLFPHASMELVEGVYKQSQTASFFNDLLTTIVERYLQARLQHDKAPSLRLLEIGAGTGGTSTSIFSRLRHNQKYIHEYCYTDLSQAFLLHAQQQYGAENPFLTYQILDIEAPIAEQGFESGTFDLVIASNAFRTTRNIHQTVRNAKALLKRNGIMILNELSQNSIFLHLTFGLLEGWWNYEDASLRLPGSPIITPETWQEVLEREGFRSVWFPASASHAAGRQIIVAGSDGAIRQRHILSPERKTAIQPTTQTSYIKNGATQQRIQEQQAASSGAIIARKYSDVTDQMIEDHLQTIILESISEILKIDERRIQEDRSFAEYGVDSIAAVKLINAINKKCNIVLQTTVLFDYNTIQHLRKHMLAEHSDALKDLLRESVLTNEEKSHTPPYPLKNTVQSSSFHQTERRKSLPQEHNIQHYQPSSTITGQPTYQHVILEKPGEIEDLQIVETIQPLLKENEVRVAVHAFSLNFGDLLCVKGLYPTMPPYPFTPGFEASGIILEVGSAVTTVQPGDAVIAVTAAEALGGQASVITCPEAQVFAKPAMLSFEEACTLPVVGITMVAAFEKAQVKRGEKVLIQTAAGGTGLVAVQLAQYYGAQIYATAGSQQKLDYLEGLNVPYRINYRKVDFEQEIDRLTQGQGVDIVINTLPGDAIQKGLNCLAPGGRYIEIAMTALKSARMVDLSVLTNNQTFYSIDLRKLGLEDPRAFQHYLAEMLQMVEQKVITPIIGQTFPFNRIKDAYRSLENRENIGKIVVSIPNSDQVSATHTLNQVSTLGQPTRIDTGKQKISHEPIAIIGMSGKFAQSKNVQELWEHLANGEDLVGEVSRWSTEELQLDATAAETQRYCKHGSFLDAIDCFDPLFFNISGLEATYMDPQQRLVLEESWKALEDAGYAGYAIEGRQCGVYVGCSTGDYQQLFSDSRPAQAFWGNATSVIPARIAYYLNLQGPAISIDTACSSSLVAIHLACQGLWTNEIGMALVGGVFLQCTPALYQVSNRAGMLSPGGRCFTFDERADGFVPGEAVSMIVVKRLTDALADGDHIYGVIRGSGINQDGATNGITAPSANAQERLESSIYETFQIHPEHIQMVEAHGTGTKLGDPIEYNALSHTFKKHTDKKGYCAIGSIKTNLGHTATAAGITSVIKVLQSLQHKQIPPSLHFRVGNENIQFENGPFYVNTTLKEWEVEADHRRCAAISSFGFSGTNAHIVIEEAPQQERKHTEKPGYLIVLSARTSDQLKQQVEQLITFCEQSRQEVDCGNMSYTLLLGRKHMKHRLACVVRNQKELVQLLKKWLNKGTLPQILVAHLGEHDQRETLALKKYGNQCILNCQRATQSGEYLEYLATISDLYTQGYTLAFEHLFDKDYYTRITLPTYPFAQERYWVDPDVNNEPCEKARRKDAPSKTEAILHPLIHRNISTFTGQQFSSTFTGDEFFLADHRVNGQPILPGVAYLEMARVAITQATGDVQARSAAIRFSNIMWTQPLVITNQPLTVHIGLTRGDDNGITYTIASRPMVDGSVAITHSQGSAKLIALETAQTLNLTAIKAGCNRNQINAQQCYEALQACGIEYGPSYQAIEQIYVGTEQLLARLVMPASVITEHDQFVLHPGIMDAAIHASIGFMLANNHSKASSLRPALAFALQELHILGPCMPNMWALVRHTNDGIINSSVQKMDIDICDDTGQIRVHIQGLATKILPDGPADTHTSRDEQPTDTGSTDAPLPGTLLLAPVWERRTIEGSDAFQTRDTHTVIIGETREDLALFQHHLPNALTLELSAEATSAQIAEQLAACGPYEHLIWIAPSAPLAHQTVSPTVKLFQQSVSACFRTLKALLLRGDAQRTLRWSVITRQGQPIHAQDQVQSAHASIHGLIGSLAKEYPQWQIRLLDLPLHEPRPLSDLLRLPSDPLGNALVYREQQWYQQRLLPIQSTPNEASLYRHGGVYVVIGGAGGVGEIWSEYMLRTYQAHLIWIGRREKDTQIQEKLDRLAAYGAAPLYLTADAADEQALLQAYQTVKERYPVIHGILHSAVGVFDQSLAQMDEAHFRAGLSAKVDISVHMGRVFQQEPLDFVLFFSSMASFSKDHGKSSYSAGSVFEDAFAHHLAQTWPCAVKVINWGYWGEIGTGGTVPLAFKKRLASSGIASLNPMEAMKALEFLLIAPINQMALLKTTQQLDTEETQPARMITIYPGLLPSLGTVLKKSFIVAPQTRYDRGDWLFSVQTALKQEVAAACNVEVENIDINTDIREYGFDTAMLIDLTMRLNQMYRCELTPSIISEQATLSNLATYLANTYTATSAEKTWGGQLDTAPVISEALDLVSRWERQAQQLRQGWGDQMQEIDELLGRLLCIQLQESGLLERYHASISEIMTRCNVPALYKPWLEISFEIVSQRNYYQNSEQSYTKDKVAHLDKEATWQEWETKKALWFAHTGIEAQVRLVETTLHALPEILTGKRGATGVLFPDSSMELVKGVYQQNPVADFFNEMLADTVMTYLQQRIRQDNTARVRILEIGAGTGGTSAMVFRKLKPYQQHIQEYCYTDVSQAFLLYAEQNYKAQNPYLTTAIFNVELPPMRQRVALGEFDIVIAANVLHATRNISHTLHNAKTLLKRHGLLLINEISNTALFTHLTFGLLEGWWLHEDSTLRIHGSPALTPENWQSVLKYCGFRSIYYPGAMAHDLGQQIVVAESDGIIQQPYREPQITTMQQSNETQSRKTTHIVSEPEPILTTTKQDTLRLKTKTYLTQLISRTLKVAVHRIDTAESLASYGIDSILVVQLNNSLRDAISNINNTIFFEYQTIDALTEYLLETYKEELELLFRETDQKEREHGESVGHTDDQSTRRNIRVDVEEARQITPLQMVNQQDEKWSDEIDMAEPIAIVGMSGRFPQADTLEAYWENLKLGKDCITEIPSERWPLEGFYVPDRQKAVEEGKSYCKWGGFLDGFADFDPFFFNMSPREAMSIDPQERIFLEECWRAFEDAGYVPSQFTERARNRIGIFGGITKTGFSSWNGITPQAFYSTSFSSLVNRASYMMDFHGPSIAIDTMCSSALVAIHQACTSLRHKEIHLALVGAVNLYLHPSNYTLLSQSQMIADSANAHVFGQGCNGFVPSEGVGAVVLKRLSDAERDNDSIIAVIRGCAVNHSGRSNGYFVPNLHQQIAVMQQALDNAHIDPRSIGYIETAANGSEIGDVVEMAAITRVFQAHRARNSVPYHMGSLKTMMGHGEAVSGMAQLIKVLLQLKQKQLCPTRVPEQLNPNINFDTLPFTLQTQLGEWPTLDIDGKQLPRRASINSIGAGGVNAHIIVEEYNVPVTRVPDRSMHLSPIIFVLSAKTPKVLQEYKKIWKTFLETHDNLHLTRLAYSLQVGRETMKYRFACVVRSQKELIHCLETNEDQIQTAAVYHNMHEKVEDTFIPEDTTNKVEAYLINQQFGPVAQLWVLGVKIPWRLLYKDHTPTPLSQLPTYPFAHKKYWLKSVNDPNDKGKKDTNGKGEKENGVHFIALDALLPDTSPSPSEKSIERIPVPATDDQHIPPTYPVLAHSYKEVHRIADQATRDSYDSYKSNTLDISVGSRPSPAKSETQTRIMHPDKTGTIRNTLKIILRDILYLDDDDEIDTDSGFNELGLNSITIVTFIQQVNRELGINLRETIVFDLTTIEALAQFINKQLLPPFIDNRLVE